MVKLRSLKAHTHGGRTVEADEEFEADDEQARSLVSLGRAVRLDEEGNPQTRVRATTRNEERRGDYQTRDLKADASKSQGESGRQGQQGQGSGQQSGQAGQQPSQPTPSTPPASGSSSSTAKKS